MPFQSARNPNFENFETLNLGILRQNYIWMWPLVPNQKYYKKEGGGFPQVRAVVNLVSLCVPMVHPCIKMLQLCIDQLIVWFE
jgi:hypothetical protein